ncbi:MAG: N-6 DNA methylase [Sphaerochaetaceae bacterium]|nr:N-6 DNA methylase [Sphaerochaetaceae bacterium]
MKPRPKDARRPWRARNEEYMPPRTRNSEFNSYVYIKNELKSLGWNTRNPARDPSGEVYTQQECLDQPEIGKYLIRLKPENVIKVREDIFWVIEAKPLLTDLEVAVSEAVDYALKINESDQIKAMFISGVAGNDIDGYIVQTSFIQQNGQVIDINFNDRPITSLLSKEQAQYLADNNTNKLNDIETSEEVFIRIAEEINKTLHSASINKDQRATVISSVLLSMISETLPNFNASPDVFIRDVNNRVEDVLISHSKREFASEIELKLPQEDSAKIKYKTAIVKTLFSLRKINIKAAMNSDHDLLGKFYEVFLKYGNGAKDIGIVLTPRHVTGFAVDILNVNSDDIIYDPACGTGGFLVSAYDKVKNESDPDSLTYFKKHRIFGIEQQANIATMAIVNMIFRGDGKNNIINDNCFAKFLTRKIRNESTSAEYNENASERPPITKVLMNPPFALKQDDEKEYKFIEHSLKQMVEGGLLFAVLPSSVMYKTGENLTWRKRLLNNHTLLSVISFPNDLFYPQAAVECIMVILRSKIPHGEKKVLWCRIKNDGFKKRKKRRLPVSGENDLEILQPIIKNFVNNGTSITEIPGIIQMKRVKFDESSLELIPQNYLDNSDISDEHIIQGMEKTLSEIYMQSLGELYYENY